jgi:3-phosphoglycerate kinase
MEVKMFDITRLPVAHKTVFVRVSYDTHFVNGKVTDDARIKNSLATIHYLLQNNCKIVLAMHVGRPNGKIVEDLRVRPIVQELHQLLPGEQIIGLHECVGKRVRDTIQKGKEKDIIMLENLRFHTEERSNDAVFAHALARHADFYINEAWGNCHRKHASMDAITRFLPAARGFYVRHEMTQLQKAAHPEEPLVWILGGAKLDKLQLIQQALSKARYVLVGGAVAFAFLKAKGIQVGMSKIDRESVQAAKHILQQRVGRKIVLPLDVVVANRFSARSTAHVVPVHAIATDQIGLDIGPRTVKLFKKYLIPAKTIVWSGPLGYFEWAQFAEGTKALGRHLGKVTGIKICGGGETAAAIRKFHLEENFTHVSSGGGSTMQYLSGVKLPALVALENNYKNWKKRVMV